MSGITLTRTGHACDAGCCDAVADLEFGIPSDDGTSRPMFEVIAPPIGPDDDRAYRWTPDTPYIEPPRTVK